MSEVRRKEHRLKYYDYSKSNYYFVTINTYDKKDIFGVVENDKMIFNDAGNKLNELVPTILDNGKAEIVVFQIMPNHIHGIIVIKNVKKNI